ncbi:MAG: hypothetical protein ACE366_11655 [Bradymonadia bacterium]
MSAFNLYDRAPPSIVHDCAQRAEPPLVRVINDGDRYVALCTVCGVVVDVSTTGVNPRGTPQMPAPKRHTPPPQTPAPKASKALLDEVWMVQFGDLLTGTVASRFVEAGWAGTVRSFETPAIMLTEAVKSLSAGRKPGLIFLSGDEATLDPLDAALGLRAIEPSWGLGPIPLVVFTDQSADERYKATLTAIGNARYMKRSLNASVDDHVARLDQMMARLTGRGRP